MTARFSDRLSSVTFFFALIALIGMWFLHFYLAHLAFGWDRSHMELWQMRLLQIAQATRSLVWFAAAISFFALSLVWRLIAAGRLRRSERLRGFEVAPAIRAAEPNAAVDGPASRL